ncbi:MAG TPA: hypothetical protein VLS89_09740 [Candidatus Nanopelagicales bacterium]|nr:hypothetical protein [Candidatus Nanopelagicales bacterium]
MSNRMFDFEVEEDDAVHPTARAWLKRIRAGQKATFTLWRKRDGLTFKPAKIYMSFETPGGRERDKDDWDVDINEALVREGVRAEDEENEAQRLSLMLRYWLSKPEEHFGPGFFEAVLMEFVQASELARRKPLDAILQDIHVNPPSRDGRAYLDCRKAVESVMKKAIRSLVRDLKYAQEMGDRILAKALGQYLDERFHITERQMLGWR